MHASKDVDRHVAPSFNQNSSGLVHTRVFDANPDAKIS
jgi:hypothetical protein